MPEGAFVPGSRSIGHQFVGVPLFHEQIYRFARPEVEGLTVGFTSPSVPYENLWVKG